MYAGSSGFHSAARDLWELRPGSPSRCLVAGPVEQRQALMTVNNVPIRSRKINAEIEVASRTRPYCKHVKFTVTGGKNTPLSCRLALDLHPAICIKMQVILICQNRLGCLISVLITAIVTTKTFGCRWTVGGSLPRSQSFIMSQEVSLLNAQLRLGFWYEARLVVLHRLNHVPQSEG